MPGGSRPGPSPGPPYVQRSVHHNHVGCSNVLWSVVLGIFCSSPLRRVLIRSSPKSRHQLTRYHDDQTLDLPHFTTKSTMKTVFALLLATQCSGFAPVKHSTLRSSDLGMGFFDGLFGGVSGGAILLHRTSSAFDLFTHSHVSFRRAPIPPRSPTLVRSVFFAGNAS